MSRIGQLTSQMNDLQRQIARLQRESEERDKQYQQEHKRRMEQLKRNMQNALQNHNTQLMRQIQNEMESLNVELMNQIKRNHDALKRELTQNLEVRHQEVLRQIEQYYQEVNERIDHEVTDIITESEERKRQLAKREYNTAFEQYRYLTNRAHNELFPGKLVIYDGTLQQAYRMMEQQKQYEASTATSVMLNVNLKDLEYQINDKLSEWLQSYLRMEQSYLKIADRVEKEILTIDGKRFNEDTVMHWTNHKYDMIFACLERVKKITEETEYHQRLVRDDVLTVVTVESYIKTGDAPKVREIDENTRILKYEIPEKLNEMKQELVSAYRCSAQRKIWAEKIQKYMLHKHNTGTPCYDGFYEENGERSDERALYRLEFEKPNGNHSMSHYRFEIVPVLTDGEMQNHIRLFMDFKFGSEQYQKKQEIKYIVGILRAIGESKAYIGIGTDKMVLLGNFDEEYSLQQSTNGSGEVLVSHSQKKSMGDSQNMSSKKNASDKQEMLHKTKVRRTNNLHGKKIL